MSELDHGQRLNSADPIGDVAAQTAEETLRKNRLPLNDDEYERRAKKRRTKVVAAIASVAVATAATFATVFLSGKGEAKNPEETAAPTTVAAGPANPGQATETTGPTGASTSVEATPQKTEIDRPTDANLAVIATKYNLDPTPVTYNGMSVDHLTGENLPHLNIFGEGSTALGHLDHQLTTDDIAVLSPLLIDTVLSTANAQQTLLAQGVDGSTHPTDMTAAATDAEGTPHTLKGTNKTYETPLVTSVIQDELGNNYRIVNGQVPVEYVLSDGTVKKASTNFKFTFFQAPEGSNSPAYTNALTEVQVDALS